MMPWRTVKHEKDSNSLPRSISTMTIGGAVPLIKDGYFTVNGRVVLTRVPGNVVASPVTSTAGGSLFIGARADAPSDHHLFTLGLLRTGYNLLCLFRFKVWWMIPRIGKSGSDVPLETQMLLLEARAEDSVLDHGVEQKSLFYILFLPLLDGLFRTTLQGTTQDELLFCVESGDPAVQTSQVSEAVFVNYGDNPYELMKDSIKLLEKHKGTFWHIDNKKVPAHLDWFGWCTWDAFYQNVDPQRIRDGLESFSDGGVAPKFLIIDDGWQDTFNEFVKEGEHPKEGVQFATRLVDIKENSKFRDLTSDDYATFPQFIGFIKERFGLKYVYLWHALVGYWGGLLPSSDALRKYQPKIVYPVQSPGNCGNVRDIAMDSIEKYGLGIVDPERIFYFYNDLHGYLAGIGVDGVKVDVQNVIETVGSGYGGRVAMSREYQFALEESVARNFKQSNLICCMSHSSDNIFSSKKSATARASEDFMPREPTLQTLHVVSVAFNSLLLGEIVVPDWDMFHSLHRTADFHAACRAVGGCAVYVSDKPGMHDFKVLRKLVLPDGSILRARYAGRPTRDCLFKDTAMDGESLLKIWNINKQCGVVGIFNCQGAGNWPLIKDTVDLPPSVNPILTGRVSPSDVEFPDECAVENGTTDFAVYAFNSRSLVKVPKAGSVEVSLAVLTCEILTISPIQVYGDNIHFAPIGLIDMYNSGGAVDWVKATSSSPSGYVIRVRARGCGRFGSYSSSKPNFCKFENKEIGFSYSSADGLLTVKLEGDCSFKDIDFVY